MLGPGDPPVGDSGPDSLPTGNVATLGDSGPDPALTFSAIVLRNKIETFSNVVLEFREPGRRVRYTELGLGAFQDYDLQVWVRREGRWRPRVRGRYKEGQTCGCKNRHGRKVEGGCNICCIYYRYHGLN